jgi:hypothetical protein
MARYFRVRVVAEDFGIRLNNPERVTQAERILAGTEPQRIVVGRLRRGGRWYNRKSQSGGLWSWHLDPDTIEFSEMSTELCDGLPSHIEDNLDHWLNNVGIFCPWRAEMVETINPITEKEVEARDSDDASFFLRAAIAMLRTESQTARKIEQMDDDLDGLSTEAKLIIGSLLIAASILFVGFRAQPYLQSITESVKQVRTDVSEIKERLFVVLDRLNQILDAIYALVDEIRGIVNEAFFTQALADVAARSQTRRYYCSDLPTFTSHFQEARQSADELTLSVNRALAFGGAKGLVHAAPGIALWAQAQNLVYRKSAQAQPPTGRSAWDHPFHKEVLGKYMEALTEAGSIWSTFNVDARHFPVKRRTYELAGVIPIGPLFVQTNKPFLPEYPLGRNDDLFSVRLDKATRKAVLISTGYEEYGPWAPGTKNVWRDASDDPRFFRHPSVVADGLSRLKPTYATRCYEMSVHLESFEEASALATEISSKCMKRPDDWPVPPPDTGLA